MPKINDRRPSNKHRKPDRAGGGPPATPTNPGRQADDLPHSKLRAIYVPRQPLPLQVVFDQYEDSRQVGEIPVLLSGTPEGRMMTIVNSKHLDAFVAAMSAQLANQEARCEPEQL